MSVTPTPDAEAAYAHLKALLLPLASPEVHLVGIYSGGVWVAQRLHQDLSWPSPLGLISSTLHRDDFSQRGLGHANQTQLPFSVDKAHLILIDDVLFTGRTVRAVLNELYDFGRPSRVQLAVLADRGGRELPVCADFAGLRLDLPVSHKLNLSRDAGRFEFTLEG
ncbi:MAG: bifunctional pyr operon transcriptional regulator/uracil phosphoribosyltransferase PyrR [Betaproteobacteria bacterium]|jgi:pyrimidine operon attenuation protein/uracil phosphoribosyltransferase|nr:bifunctional pyr operon transcriptional regulator/uracil phosphoribosyltransferase PyrR [Betaproteobacteria bacterium]NBP45601.1 bifunctional pyr operon transcriptional regulator/uracil phosphoribosyltransferase PyrR [Betaproteobacteria bacterium]